MHHGTILYDFDLPAVSHYLRPPERMPAYRAGRPHEEFVRNLPVERGEIMAKLSRAFEAVAGVIPDEAMAKIPELVAEKYSRDEWNLRR